MHPLGRPDGGGRTHIAGRADDRGRAHAPDGEARRRGSHARNGEVRRRRPHWGCAGRISAGQRGRTRPLTPGDHGLRTCAACALRFSAQRGQHDLDASTWVCRRGLLPPCIPKILICVVVGAEEAVRRGSLQRRSHSHRPRVTGGSASSSTYHEPSQPTGCRPRLPHPVAGG